MNKRTPSYTGLTVLPSGSTLLAIFGGDIETLRTFLIDERLPDGWEPTMTDAKGLTMMKFNTTVLPVEMMTNETAFARQNES